MNEAIIDLHTHSTCSDGSCTPRELIRLASAASAKAVALTDHDTVEGLEEARTACEECAVEFVSGIEISAEYSPGTMHILGYCIDERCESLAGELTLLREARENRNPRIAARLQELGIEIDYSEVAEKAGGAVVGRPHFASVMLEKGYIASIQEAFDRYLAKGSPAYVEKTRLAPDQAIRMIHSAGGVAVLAHPYQLKCDSEEELGRLLDDLAASGLDGIEAVYSRHSVQQRVRYAEMARTRGMLVSGGSDYHGTYKPDLNVVTGKGDLAVPYSLLEQIKDRAESLRC